MTTLGELLQTARRATDRAQAEIAKTAGISPAYLNKLESDGVEAPSPHILHRLSKALKLSYEELMRAAGYVVPGESTATGRKDFAFLSEELTSDERDELENYLVWYRERQRRRKH